MKKASVQFLSIICAAYFLLAGSGFNLVRYCCDSCANEGIEAVAAKSCAGIHHEHRHNGEDCCTHNHHDTHSHDMACGDINHDTDCCHLYRIQTDTPSFDLVKYIFEETEFTLDYLHAVSELFLTEYIDTERPSFVPPDNIPLSSGRDILAYHSVLLI